MKKIIALLLFSTLLISCSFPSYIFEDNSSKTGLNLKEGKWLLNEIDEPTNINSGAKNVTLTNLTKHLGNRLSYIYDVKGLILPKKIELNPNKKTLQLIKTGSGFDFFINVKINIKKNSLQDFDLSNHRYNKNLSKSVELFFEVYDLNNPEIIYSKKVTGSIKINDNNNSDINFSKSTSKMVLGCLNKVLKDINRKSIK